MNTTAWRHAARAGLLACAGLAGSAAFSQTTPPDTNWTARARQELASHNPAAALDALANQAREQPASIGFSQHFLRGAAWQQVAGGAADAGARAKALDEAEQAYVAALKVNPESGPLLTNLALLATARGDAVAAGQWYEKAAAVRDTRGGLYALNYATYLESQGEIGRAIDSARQALRTSPRSPTLRAYLASLYLRAPDDARLVGFLTDALLQGDTLFALSTALDALQPGRARASAQRRPLLLVAAAGLARDPVTLGEGLDDANLAKLQRATDDPTAGAAARQLLQVLQHPSEATQDLSEWRSSAPSLPAAKPMTPRSEMRALLQGLAKRQGKRDAARAERWLRLAVELGERGPDPDAFLQLVGLLADTGQQAKLKPLMDRYQWELFTEKGEAYARGDWPQIYRMHLALGMTYAQMKVWTSATPYQNALFQLEHARLAAEQANRRQPPATDADRLVLPPEAAVKLAEAYTATGNAKKAALVKLESAELLSHANRLVESKDVLLKIQPSEARSFDASAAQRYEALEQLPPQRAR